MQPGAGAVEIDKVVRKCLLHGGRGVLDVKDIAADEENIGMLRLAPALQLTEEVGMLIAAVVVLIEYLTQMQVGCVQ